MSYAIVGFGKIGQALAHAFARKNMPIEAENRTHILASISPWSILLLTVPTASIVDGCLEPDLRDLVRYISLPREVIPEEVMTSLDEHGLSLRLPIMLERSVLPSWRSDRFRDTTGRTESYYAALSEGSEQTLPNESSCWPPTVQ
jgi:hypothetical protein